MGTAIRVNDGVIVAADRRLDGRIQHGTCQLGIGVCPDRRADDHAVEAIDHRREIHLASRDLEFRYGGQPLFVWRPSMEFSIDGVHRCRTDFRQV